MQVWEAYIQFEDGLIAAYLQARKRVADSGEVFINIFMCFADFEVVIS